MSGVDIGLGRHLEAYLAIRDALGLAAGARPRLLRRAVATAAAACPTLGAKKVSPHVLRHSTAMHLFQAGVDMAVIALWLGHESLETTHVYVEADLATKQRALDKLAPMPGTPARFHADDKLLAFLAAL